MNKVKRGLKLLGKIVIVIALVVIVTDLVLTLVLSRKVASEIAKLKASGEPTTLADIAPKKVRNSENAAVIYARVFAEMEEPLTDEDSEAFSSLLSPEKRLDDPASWARGMKVLERNRHVIDLIEQATSRPKCVFPVEWEKGAAALSPHLPKLRSLARLLAADAIVSAVDNRPDEAVRSLALGPKLSESLAEEPSIISQLVRYAALRIHARSLELVAQETQIDSDQAKRLYYALASIDLNPGYARAMRMETVFGLWSFDEFRKNPEMINEYMTFGCLCSNLTGPDPEAWYPVIAPLHSRTPIVYADELVYLKGMEDRMRNTVLPYRMLKTKRSALLEKEKLPAYALGSETLLSVFSSIIDDRDDAIAEVSGGQVLCALLAYRDRFGGYPRSLGELRSRLGWKLPQDPYSGKDFVYRRQGKGCIFYSIGENLKDDGGISYDHPPEKLPVEAPIETPPPGYTPATAGAPQASGEPQHGIPLETPPPGTPTDEVISPPMPPPHLRPPKPPFSTEDMRYSTYDGRNAEDIIWQLAR